MIPLLENIHQRIGQIVWGPPMILLFLASGLWFTWGTKAMQITRAKTVLKNTLGTLRRNRHRKEKGISPFQAMSTALAGTMGVGNITGIAAAITLGGPGAIFWMWVSAFLGMMSKYAEVLLACTFRQQNPDGSYYGGPMYYMEKGLGSKSLAIIFSGLCVLASFGVGNMTQSNAAAMAAGQLFGAPAWLSGLVLSVCIALVIVGGIRRIAAVTEWLIPFLSLFYLVCCVAVLWMQKEEILPAFRLIFSSAFSHRAAAGGMGGFLLSKAVRFGISRGIFTNEAGLGSAPIAHASADAKHPAAQGMWGIFEVFADTLVVCTLTALVILTSGVAAQGFSGAEMTAQAFSIVLGPWGGNIVLFSLIFFAVAAMLGWFYYGEQSLGYLTKNKTRPKRIYQGLFLFCCFLGAVTRLDLVWEIADILNALMAAPNLLAVLSLSEIVFAKTKEYLSDETVFSFNKK